MSRILIYRITISFNITDKRSMLYTVHITLYFVYHVLNLSLCLFIVKLMVGRP